MGRFLRAPRCALQGMPSRLFYNRNIIVLISAVLLVSLAALLLQFSFYFGWNLGSSWKFDRSRSIEAVFEAVPAQLPSFRSPKTGKEWRCPKKVLFLKTHKTGSSTITNILNRFADRYNKTVALPKDASMYTFWWPIRFDGTMVDRTHHQEWDVLANHARFDRVEMTTLFPRHDSLYVTILRDPVYQWESTMNFLQPGSMFGFKQVPLNITQFFAAPPTADQIDAASKERLITGSIKNPQMFDLGYDRDRLHHLDDVKRAIQKIDEDFDLVMINEVFEESILLLKKMLCVSTDDVVSLKLNERLDQQKSAMTAQDVKNIISWNSADVLLYRHFRRKILALAEDFITDQDLRDIKERTRFLKKTCLFGSTLQFAYAQRLVKGYSLKSDIPSEYSKFCRNMNRLELSFINYFRGKYGNRTKAVEVKPTVRLYLDDSDERFFRSANKAI